MADERCLWIDIETTGLNADTDIPLEVGLMLTDMYGDNRYSRSWLIQEFNDDWAEALRRGMEHEIVGPMHQRSGLWADLSSASLSNTVTRSQASVQMIGWLSEHNVERGTLPLFGSSIGSLDRPFVLKHFPEFNEFTHYRNIDISTIKELCRRHNPTVFAAKEDHIEVEDLDGGEHRVLNDIRYSIAEYKFYVDNFLWCE